MKIEKSQIKEAIDAVAKKWDYSGHFVLLKDDKEVYNKTYGFENPKEKIKTSKDTRYIMDSYSEFFVKLAVLMEVTNKNIKFSDKVSKFIPELKHGDKITINHLLKNESGLFDYQFGHVMVQCEADKKIQSLSEKKRVRKEQTAIYKNRIFKEILSVLNTKELEYQPGKDDEHSASNKYVLAEVIKRVTGKTVLEYLDKKVFKKLGLKSIKYGTDTKALSFVEHKDKELIGVPVNFAVDGVFTIKGKDLVTLMQAIKDKKFLSKEVWKKALKLNKDGVGILFRNSNGFLGVGTGFLGFQTHLFVDYDKGIMFTLVTNAQPIFKREDNVWHYYRKDFIDAVSAIYTRPKNTKMVKVNKKNFWDAVNLTVKEEQYNFVLDAKASIAMTKVYKTQEVFVQMEGDVAVGLLVLDVDKKKKHYNIDIIIIDQKYQNKGFGTLMVKWAVEYLKEAGAKKLLIGVARENTAAKKVYLGAGFVPKLVDGGGMELEMKL